MPWSENEQVTGFYDLVRTGTPQNVQAAISNGVDLKARDSDSNEVGSVQNPIIKHYNVARSSASSAAQSISRAGRESEMSEQTRTRPGARKPAFQAAGHGEEVAERPMSHWIAPVLVALIGAFMSILDSSIVNVAIPTMMSVFNVGRTRSSG